MLKDNLYDAIVLLLRSMAAFFASRRRIGTHLRAREQTPWEAVYAFRQGRKLVKPTFQGRVYNFLERPKEWKSIVYHSAIYTSILGSLLLSVLTTVAEHKATYSKVVYVVEIMLVSIFTMEYVARLWSAGCRSKYLGIWGRLRFVTKPICIIDLIIIVSSFLVIIFGSDGKTFGVKAIRGVRFLQILRMLHVDREGGCWRLLGSVIMEHRQVRLLSVKYHYYIVKTGILNISSTKFQSILNGNEDYQNDSICEDGIYGNSTCYTQLSETHKNAIRAIRKIKYFVAKRKFQQARKPYDVGDVIEQYSQGQISMNVRLKELHRRLDQMLGKSGTQLSGKNGKSVTLGEKLHQMDQQIQMMDRKIDNISYAIHTIVRELQKTPRIETQPSSCS
ncbi:potassium voltage-gated channel subfamily KQT member 1 [Nephila pilipes]|uniref:IKs producing slow voltage-gated potassium channel subunit alpha KvLQT1 n=1 Tax=Nephila pilipes TaxID=299642 RepID=A0A8X6UIA3_NEPPI|nr:potassium voltage-gated channel subfamily KQT member 1 [Nephila pilipes]